ncbi:hypothetical protein HZH66_013026 [Vespula vulgaris]|uniref:Uncharacterized protein n=1 Tax=Vespula vulgaris TaxID=7454 RepID=A0A834J803_VESVU|nr:hypothetical protein HZH66_013026 [Vespula vulgaris]
MSGLWPTFIDPGSVVHWTSTSELRNFRTLCVGLRPVNLEIFADAIRASINEQPIKVYNTLFDFRLKCEVGMLGFGGRQQRQVFDQYSLFLVQLCFGLRRVNLEIFSSSGDFENQSSRVDLEIFAPLKD